MNEVDFYLKHHELLLEAAHQEAIEGDLIESKNKVEEFVKKAKEKIDSFSPEFEAMITSSLAVSYFKIEDFKTSFDVFYSALKADPESEKTHHFLFFVIEYVALKFVDNDKDFIGKFNLFSEIKAKNDFASILLSAVFWCIKQKPERMYASLKEAEKLSEDNIYLLYYFAEYHRLRREFDEAIVYFCTFSREMPHLYISTFKAIECFYEKAIEFLREGNYLDAKSYINNGIGFIADISAATTKEDEETYKGLKFFPHIKNEMAEFKKFLLFDYQLEKLIKVSNIDELYEDASMLFEFYHILNIPSQKHIASETAANLLRIKMSLLIIVLDAISFRDELERSKVEKMITESREFFKDSGFIRGEQVIDSIEAFIVSLQKYNSREDISKEQEVELLKLLRPMYVLAKELTVFEAESQRNELFKKELISSVREEIQRSLSSNVIQGSMYEIQQKNALEHNDRINLEDDHKYMQYRVWYKDTDTGGELINVDDKNNIFKDNKTYDLLILREETITQVFIKGKKTTPLPGKIAFRILVYVLKHKGTGGTAWNIAKHVYNVDEIEKFNDIREMAKALRLQPKLEKAKMQDLATNIQDDVEYFSNLVRRRINDLNKTFLKKINTTLNANDMDEYEFTTLVNFCLIEKI